MTSGLGGRAQLAGSRGWGSGGSRTPPPHRRKHPRERPGACLCPGLQGQLEPGSEPGARSGGAQEDPFRQTLPACRGARAFNPCLGRPGSQLCAVVPLVGRLSRSATLLPGGLRGAGAFGSRVASKSRQDTGGGGGSQRAVLEFVHWDALRSHVGEEGGQESPEPAA